MSFIINGNIYAKTPLLKSIDTNDLTSFMKLIEEGEYINGSDEDNQIILLYIFYKKNKTFLRLYFHFRYNIKNGVIKNIFPFFYSFKNFIDYKELFQILLYNGLNVNFLYEKRQYIRSEEVERNEEDVGAGPIERFLLNQEQNRGPVEGKNSVLVRESLLINCCRDNQLYIVEKLLQFGADPWVRNYEGKSALDVARDKRFDKIIELIERYG